MYLVKNRHHNHVSSDTTNEFESVIISDKLVQTAKDVNKIVFKAIYFLFKLARKLGFSTISKTRKNLLRKPLADSKHLFTVMMGLDEAKYKPHGYTTNHCRSIFLFDAWEKDYQRVIDFIKKYKIDFVFVTASQSAQKLNTLLGERKFFWIPEGIKREEYQFNDYKNKSIDVLSIGRKYDSYHNQIKEQLELNGRTYLYEKVKGEIIFPTRKEFIEGLSNSKISICIPSNITHPERAGSIETMTIRYLQSMLSKCLIVGHAPKEMIELFGYNPVIEIDYNCPAQQLNKILANFEEYIPLIEKNYANVVANHTWEDRWNSIKNIFDTLSKKK